MLAGKGFESVLNVSGGIKAYQGNVAVGQEDLGLHLFTGDESIEDTLLTAYSLEQGLRQFYLSLIERVNADKIKKLFATLADIEIIHQDNLLAQYRSITGREISREQMAQAADDSAVEGGMTTEEYLNRFNADLDSSTEVIAMAMSIEAQALDLYERAARRSDDAETRSMLQKIANEEKTHLEHLGRLMDSL